MAVGSVACPARTGKRLMLSTTERFLYDMRAVSEVRTDGDGGAIIDILIEQHYYECMFTDVQYTPVAGSSGVDRLRRQVFGWDFGVPPPREHRPAVDEPALTGKRVILSTTEGFVYDMRAAGEVHTDGEGGVVVDILSEGDYSKQKLEIARHDPVAWASSLGVGGLKSLFMTMRDSSRMHLVDGLDMRLP